MKIESDGRKSWGNDMNIYDERLEKLISDYGLKYKGIIDSTDIHNIVMGLFQERCLTKRIALWGAGRSNSLTSHASVILSKYASCMRGLVCLIDSAKELQGTEFMHYPVISPETIKDRDIELIIVASRANAGSICESIKKYAPWCEVLDIYAELRTRGIVIPYNFYEERSLYTELYDRRIEYEQAKTLKAKSEKLRSLISAYLNIRDIPYTIDFCKEYIKYQYEGFEQIDQFLKDLLNLVEEVKAKNGQRRQDIIIHFIDALRAIDVAFYEGDKITFNILKDYFSNMMYFENAYSTAPTTYESMRSIICEQYPFEVNVYNNNFIYNFEEFSFLPKVYEKGYDIQFYTSEEYRIMFEDERIHYINQIHMSQKLWTLMCNRAVCEKPIMAFLYYPWELHFPLVCGYHSAKPHLPGFVDVGIVDMSDFIENQFADCLHYVDKEFAFYYSFYNEETYLNIFSDHSQIVYDDESFMPYYMYYNNKERATHCTMAISGPGICKGIYQENFSMIDYNKALRKLVLKEQEEIPVRNILLWQYYSCHNKRFRDAAEERGYTDYIDGIHCYMVDGFIYSCTKNGKKEVYSIKNLRDNLIDTETGRDCVAQVEKEYGACEFPDFLDVHFVS
ncbi:MAG: hypothetical protein NC347_01945 [Clostridium sp.]|nr:hypothetical protein [Clostridium sp.]